MSDMAEPIYITKDAFDIQVKSIRDRADSEVRVSDARFDRLEALIARNMIEQRSAISELKSELTGEIKALNERIDKNLAEYKAVASDMKAEISDIRGDVKALNASVQSLQQRRSWDIAWISIAVAVGIALIQIFAR